MDRPERAATCSRSLLNYHNCAPVNLDESQTIGPQQSAYSVGCRSVLERQVAIGVVRDRKARNMVGDIQGDQVRRLVNSISEHYMLECKVAKFQGLPRSGRAVGSFLTRAKCC